MTQLTFAEVEYAIKKRKTRREKFLERMDKLIPWKEVEAKLLRHYPKGANGRPPYPLQTMLRVHCLQLFYNLSDPAMEDALYEIESMRRFANLRLSGSIPDETTILNFRHFLEEHKLGEMIFKAVNQHLSNAGLILKEGTIVDATIIEAPSSTKNREKARDPEMHQTKKGNEWHFGMKMHIGTDETFGLIHTIATTPANVHDINMVGKLLHGEEDTVWGDAGYTGMEKRAEHKHRKVNWNIAMRHGQRTQFSKCSPENRIERVKASVRAKVEHPFLIIKRIFGYSKVRYRGLAKNTERLHVLAAFSNLMKSEKFIPA